MSASACLTIVALMFAALCAAAMVVDRWPPADVTSVERERERRRALQRADGWGEEEDP